MQQILLHSRTWTALPGCLHGVPQATLLGHFSVGSIADDGLARADRVLAEALDDLGLSVTEDGGALGLLKRVAHVVEAAQCFFGHPVSSAFCLSPREAATEEPRSVFDAALPYHHPASARGVIAWAVGSINKAMRDGETSIGEVRRSLAALGKSIRPAGLKGINSVHFVRAAYQLEIPVAAYVGEVYRFGTGVHTRALRSTLTDRTSSIGVSLAKSKIQTASVLGFAGLPTAQPETVGSLADALRAASRIGYPVVLKPNDKDGGVGVMAGLANADEVRSAFAETAAVTRQVLVEKHFAGQDYRLTVHDGDVIKVEQRIACGIVGNGAATVAELVHAKQSSPHLRRIARETGKVPLSLDQEAMRLLEAEGLSETSVPDEGRRIPLRRKNNISSGGEQVAVSLPDVHAGNAVLAVRAAKLLFLDIAGVDLIIPDIGRSWRDDGGIICEVNAIPQVGVRTSPDIYREMLQRVVGEQPRIPAYLLVTADDAANKFDAFTNLAEQLGCNAIACREGIWIDGQQAGGRPANSFTSASSLLRDRDARSALCVISAADVRTRGLPLDRFDTIFLPDPLMQDRSLRDALGPHAGSIVGTSSHA